MGTSVTARRLVRRAVPGFVVLFGAESVVEAARTLAEPAAVPLVVLGVAATVCWGVSLWRTLGGVGSVIHPLRAVGLFFAATFINGVTPFGQTGGDPVSAVLVERTAGVDYEAGLAAIVSVTAVNRVVSALVAGVAGTLYLRASPGWRIEGFVPVASVELVAAGTVITVFAVVGTVGTISVPGVRAWVGGWMRTERTAVSARLPESVRRSLDNVGERVGRFRRALRHTLTDPTTAATVVAFGLLGELALGATLWGALSLVGVTVPLALALMSVPLSRVGAVAPTPGGAGGVEVALAGVLVALGGVAAPVAGVAALAFRLLTFAVPTIVGGGVVALTITHE